MSRREDALKYHREGRPGKLEIRPTTAVATARDLSLAYSPGVAEPCREIAEDPLSARDYTARGNLVGVITNGTAVLGLGNIGPLASKPVMEGKAVLFKKYADIDVFDIEVNETDPQKFIEVVRALEPTFGGINLEDIRGPDCFEIEQTLEKEMGIPVFHDDQHGTAIIGAAALINAAELQGKELGELKIACLGAGAAAIGCMRLWEHLGVKRENMVLCDSKGVLHDGRDDVRDPNRLDYLIADDGRRTIADALVGADVMLGLSVGNVVDEAMVKTMADKPIIFALANPDPEIPFEVAKAARPDAIVGTGRSDYPNQVNNVLGFPYIFRGALDVGATHVNLEMKLAAATALAELAREGVSEAVMAAYEGEILKFGPDYIIPKPMDERGLSWVAPAVAKAAMESGIATKSVDIEEYRESLLRRLNPSRRVMWHLSAAARKIARKRVVYPQGRADQVLRAAEIAVTEGLCYPVIVGHTPELEERATEIGVSLEGIEIADPRDNPERLEHYTDLLYEKRMRRGLSRQRTKRLIRRSRTIYGLMMLEAGDVDGFVGGVDLPYSETIRPAIRIVGTKEGVKKACGAYVVVDPHRGAIFFADTTLNIDPDAETLAEIAIQTAEVAKELGVEPRIAMLSYSNFGDNEYPQATKVARATELVRQLRPDLAVEGEMQADLALDHEGRQSIYPFSKLAGDANVLVFPNLDAGNIAYRLMGATGAETIGPFVLGLGKPVNVLSHNATATQIAHLTTLTVVQAERLL